MESFIKLDEYDLTLMRVFNLWYSKAFTLSEILCVYNINLHDYMILQQLLLLLKVEMDRIVEDKQKKLNAGRL